MAVQGRIWFERGSFRGAVSAGSIRYGWTGCHSARQQNADVEYYASHTAYGGHREDGTGQGTCVDLAVFKCCPRVIIA